MINKVVIGILVILLVLMGGLGAYSYILNRQLDDLGQHITLFQTQQTTNFNSINDELSSFRRNTLDTLDIVREGIDNNKDKIISVSEEINLLDVRVDRNLSKINSIRTDLNNISDELSLSMLNASDIYQEARQSVVRITDGDVVIGSGFFASDDGYILTASHVIEGLDTIGVVLADGSLLSATVKGDSPRSDIAVLTVSNASIDNFNELADSSSVLVGQPVITIGSPFNLAESLTYGVVSQLDRYIVIGSDSDAVGVANLIQFDAPVNPGNSGCPLFNSTGEVVGMVIAGVRPEEGGGIYYAVSSNKLSRVANSLIINGSFDYPWVGIEPTELTPQEAIDRGLDSINGLLVSGVVPGGPADDARIKVNDIIIAIDGNEIKTIDDLTSYIGEKKSPGQAAIVTVLREGARLNLTIEIGKYSS